MENPTIYNTSATAGTFEVRCSNPTASNLSAVADLIIMKMETEIWKSVVGYEGLYEISNLGRVHSLENEKIKKERMLKIGINSAGYPCVSLYNDRFGKTKLIHLLIAAAFLDHAPCGHKLVIDHINGVRTDNRVENLRIVTPRFNNSEGYRKNRDRLGSQYTGVTWDKGRNTWRSQIVINGKQKYLGAFETEIKASNAYQNELLKL